MAYGIVEGTAEDILLKTEGHRMLQRGQAKAVLDICSRFPRLYKATTPSIGCVEALAFELTGQPNRAHRRYLRMLQHGHDPMVQNLLGIWHGRYGERRAFLAWSPTTDAWQGIQKLHGGRDATTGVLQLREGWQKAQDVSDPAFLFEASHAHALVGTLYTGRFEDADCVARQVRPILRRQDFLYHYAHLCLDQALAAAVSGSLEQAERRLQEASRHAGLFSRSFVDWGVRALRCYLDVEHRNREAIRHRSEWPHWKALPSQMRPWHLRTLILGCILDNALKEAHFYARELRRLVEGEQGLYIPECLLALACLDEARQRYESALAYAVAAYRMAVELPMPFWQMKASAYLAWFLRHRRRSDAVAQSEQFLLQSVRLALENGWLDFWRTDSMGYLRRLFESCDRAVPSTASITPTRLKRLETTLSRSVELPATRLPAPELDDQAVLLHCVRHPLGDRLLEVLGLGVLGLDPEAMSDRTASTLDEVEAAQAALCRRLRVPNFSAAVQKGLGLGLAVADPSSVDPRLTFRYNRRGQATRIRLSDLV